MRVRPNIVLFILVAFASTAVSAEPSRGVACTSTCIDIFGGTLPIPTGYRLQTDFGDVLRLVRIERDPDKPYGNIHIGKVESLPSREEREKSAKELGASFERIARGTLRVEITTRTTKQLLVDKPVRYVAALVYDNRHYMRITDSNPDLWKQMLEQCMRCGQP